MKSKIVANLETYYLRTSRNQKVQSLVHKASESFLDLRAVLFCMLRQGIVFSATSVWLGQHFALQLSSKQALEKVVMYGYHILRWFEYKLEVCLCIWKYSHCTGKLSGP